MKSKFATISSIIVLAGLTFTGFGESGDKIIVAQVVTPPKDKTADVKQPDVKTPDKLPVGPKHPESKHGRGLKMPSKEVLDARHKAAFERHGNRMKALPKATPATYDCRQFGYVPPIKDQGQCGSCYQFGVDICEMSFMKNGLMAVDSGGLAEQYGMDCQNFGGCNGGDEAQVIDWCKTNGYPTTKDYGPYTASSNNCALKSGTKLMQIIDWGYCANDQGQGVAAVQDIKNAMVAYGPISIAVDASGFDSYSSGVLSGTGHNIDHAVILVGWDDSKGTNGAWLLRNQWGTSWGISGYMWIEYGSYDVGTEAIWCTSTTLPTPTPIPPTPIPPTPTQGSITLKIPGQPDQVFPINVSAGVPAGMELAPVGTAAKLQAINDILNPVSKGKK
jgi:C1A family cysteine protease